MSSLIELKTITEKFVQLFEKPILAKDRDQLLEEVNRFLDQRDQLLKKIKAPFSEEEANLVSTIMEQDKEIQLKLDHLFLTLKSELRDVKKQKSSSEKYLDPYRHVATNDGSYWDKKK
ncbi:MAG TPA: flagellar protein FliT [Bacilli bacterium]|uniref:Flagellar protein FliT n=1 Tax=Amphibacillus indicireducens TaxID=1076330 RepID=A0ABP7VEG3_9BACI|nr:flagellar protein FliT [Bacilli bacterium]